MLTDPMTIESVIADLDAGRCTRDQAIYRLRFREEQHQTKAYQDLLAMRDLYKALENKKDALPLRDAMVISVLAGAVGHAKAHKYDDDIAAEVSRAIVYADEYMRQRGGL